MRLMLTVLCKVMLQRVPCYGCAFCAGVLLVFLYLNAAILCSCRWLEENWIVVSVHLDTI